MGKAIIILTVLVSIAVLLVLVVVLRGFMLWYWRVNDIVAKLDLILAELKKFAPKELKSQS